MANYTLTLDTEELEALWQYATHPELESLGVREKIMTQYLRIPRAPRPSELAMAAVAKMRLPNPLPVMSDIPKLIKGKGWEVAHSEQDGQTANFWIEKGDGVSAVITADIEADCYIVGVVSRQERPTAAERRFRSKIEGLLSDNGFQVERVN